MFDVAAYSLGAPLPVSIGVSELPMGGTTTVNATLESKPVLLNGTPMARVEVSAIAPIRVRIAIQESDIAGLPEAFRDTVTVGSQTHERLKPKAFGDLFLVLEYSTAQ